jgi:hypothetical protein
MFRDNWPDIAKNKYKKTLIDERTKEQKKDGAYDDGARNGIYEICRDFIGNLCPDDESG